MALSCKRALVALVCLLLEASLARSDHDVPIGCFLYGYRADALLKDIASSVVSTPSLHACQEACQSVESCESFGYRRDSESCWLVGSDITGMDPELGPPPRLRKLLAGGLRELGLAPILRDPLVVIGSADCSKSTSALACTTTPGLGFPGATAAESASAWPNGVVPHNLQCWDRDSQNFTLLPCTQQQAVLDDLMVDGWPGQCLELKEVKDDATEEWCREICQASANCSVWQLAQDKGEEHLSCWQGLGLQCYAPSHDAKIVASQRILRGRYRVLKHLRGYFTSGLRPAFHAFAPIHGFGLTEQDGIRECNHTCLSLVSCEMWQYSIESGCWVHDPEYNNISHPATSASMSSTAPGASSVVAGEYIQRSCKMFPDLQEPPAPPSAGALAPTEPTSTATTAAETIPTTADVAETATPTATPTIVAETTTLLADEARDKASPSTTTGPSLNDEALHSLEGPSTTKPETTASEATAEGGTTSAAGSPTVHLKPHPGTVWNPSPTSTKTPCSMPPGEGKTANESVTVKFTVTGMDYDALQEEEELQCALVGGCQEAIASEAGDGVNPEDVIVSLSQGSVVVESSVRLSSSNALEEVRSRLLTSTSLSNTIEKEVTNSLGNRLSEVSNGPISISSVSPLIPDVKHRDSHSPQEDASMTAGPPSPSKNGPPSPSEKLSASGNSNNFDGAEQEAFWKDARVQLVALCILVGVLVGLILCLTVGRKRGKAGLKIQGRPQSHDESAKEPLRESANDTDTDSEEDTSTDSDMEASTATMPTPKCASASPDRSLAPLPDSSTANNRNEGIAFASAQAAAVLRGCGTEEAMRRVLQSPTPADMQGAQADLDLVTVVPEGLLVTPLTRGAIPPPNVPLLTPEDISSSVRGVPTAPQQMYVEIPAAKPMRTVSSIQTAGCTHLAEPISRW